MVNTVAPPNLKTWKLNLSREPSASLPFSGVTFQSGKLCRLIIWVTLNSSDGVYLRTDVDYNHFNCQWISTLSCDEHSCEPSTVVLYYFLSLLSFGTFYKQAMTMQPFHFMTITTFSIVNGYPRCPVMNTAVNHQL